MKEFIYRHSIIFLYENFIDNDNNSKAGVPEYGQRGKA